ncbi:hypothetical protein E4U41_007428 [Claviceps citrina]|nr:hypothetical protein E4U41_007428 [Claviceps citrina]
MIQDWPRLAQAGTPSPDFIVLVQAHRAIVQAAKPGVTFDATNLSKSTDWRLAKRLVGNNLALDSVLPSEPHVVPTPMSRLSSPVCLCDEATECPVVGSTASLPDSRTPPFDELRRDTSYIPVTRPREHFLAHANQGRKTRANETRPPTRPPANFIQVELNSETPAILGRLWVRFGSYRMPR